MTARVSARMPAWMSTRSLFVAIVLAISLGFAMMGSDPAFGVAAAALGGAATTDADAPDATPAGPAADSKGNCG
eukprot:7731933-Alexandrium_andersonii.AAC.1